MNSVLEGSALAAFFIPPSVFKGEFEETLVWRYFHNTFIGNYNIILKAWAIFINNNIKQGRIVFFFLSYFYRIAGKGSIKTPSFKSKAGFLFTISV